MCHGVFTTITDDEVPDLAGLLGNECVPVSTKRRLVASAAQDGGHISFISFDSANGTGPAID